MGANYILSCHGQELIDHEEILIKAFDRYKKLGDCRTTEDFYAYMKWINIGFYSNAKSLHKLDFLNFLEKNQNFWITCHSYFIARSRADLIEILEELCKWFNKNVQGYIVKMASVFDQPGIHFIYKQSSSLLEKL